MGRPSKLTEELTDQLCEVFKQGQTSIKTACDFVGLGESTFHAWMRREDPEYLEFRESIEKARASAVQGYLKVIHHAAQSGTWQAAAWWLERVLPDQYGRKTTVETISRDALVAELERMEAELAENDR